MLGRAFRWLMPHPFLTLLLAVVWIVLQNEFSAGMAVFGVILGILIPWGTSAWWPDTPHRFRLFKMIRSSFLAMLVSLVSTVQVRWLGLSLPMPTGTT